MRILHRIHQAIREQRYRISSHANEEMSEDKLETKDIESIILTGKVIRKFTGCPRIQVFSNLLIIILVLMKMGKGNTVAKVKMDDIIMSKNENHKPKPHQATQSIL